MEKPGLDVQKMFNRTGLDVMKKTGDSQVPWLSTTPFPDYFLARGTTTIISPSSVSTAKGSLKIESEPIGAEIFIQGQFKGRAPIEISGMAQGSYSIEARLSGHSTEQKKVSINQGRKAVVTFYLDTVISKAKLFVTTSPLDCQVKILNINPVFYNGIELEKGKYKLSISKSGYETKIQWVDISSSQGIDLYVELEEKAASSQSPGTASPGQTWKDSVTGMEFVRVGAGCFQMGQTESEKQYLIKEVGQEKYKKWYEGELPRHEVCVDGFWMAKHEVTRGQFRKFVRDTGHRTDADKKGKAWIFNKDTSWKWKEMPGYNWEKTGYSQNDDHPVACVSWNDAKAFIQWLNSKTGDRFALPSEAQWEYGARAGTDYMRFWGTNDSDACTYANAAGKGGKINWSKPFPCNDGYDFTSPAGAYRPNPFGLYDMLGNVWEWCEDVYEKNAYSKHPRNNPLVTSGGSNRVDRGGSWFNNPRSLRCAYRVDRAGDTGSYLGFRLIRTD
jgi:formylglycine-generating enzyme required for sulfatase activity